MKDELIPIEDFFVEKAKANPKLLQEFWIGALEDFKECDYQACCGSLATYIVASGKLEDVANFLNRPTDELQKQLEDMKINKKEHLEKIIEFLQIDIEL